MHFKFKQTNMDDIILIKTKRSEDHRGVFIKGFEKESFSFFFTKGVRTSFNAQEQCIDLENQTFNATD